MSFLKQKVCSLFRFDLCSLAFFRIALGLIVIADLIVRASSLGAHYTDAGVFPRFAFDRFNEPWYFSIHSLSGAWGFQAFLFGLQGIFTFLFVIGYRVRLMTFLCWFLVSSVQTHNPLIVFGGDQLLRVLLFWSLFLPLGARFSLDRVLNSSKINQAIPNNVCSMGSVAYVFQLCFVYWFTALLKGHPFWTQDFSAIYYALNFEHYTKPLGLYLLQFPELLKWITAGTLALEFAGPLLLFIPFYSNFFRITAIGIFWFFHLVALGLTLDIGFFEIISAIAWIPLIPGCVWDRLFKSKGESSSPALSVSLPWLPQVLAAFLLIYVLAWNIRALDLTHYQKYFPRQYSWFGKVLHIDQFWTMFAPFPPTDDGWYVIPGRLKNDKTVDLFKNGKELDWKKPALVSAVYPDHRWRKLMLNLRYRYYLPERKYYADYLCRKWNAEHSGGDKLNDLMIFYMLEETQPNYQASEIQQLLLWEQKCRE